MIATIMEGSVKAVAAMGWEGLKLDSCSQFNNLSWWNELINATGKPVLLENCHQGGFDPGMVQWQVRPFMWDLEMIGVSICFVSSWMVISQT